MAIDINETSAPSAQNSTDWKGATIPATQGNVVETVKEYNKQVRTRYYDKQQSTNDVNALQKSLYTLVKALDNSNAITESARLEANDDVENQHTSIASTTNLSTDNTGTKAFNLSGLIQKVNIIANLLSGTTDTSKETWAYDAHGNNAGSGDKATFTPVIGLTRANSDDNYKAVLTHDSDGNKVVDIFGLTTANGEYENMNSLKKASTDKKDGETLLPDDISGNVILSEREVADMVSKAVFTVLGAYDYQISSMLGYLLYSTDDLPDSFQYVLKHTQDEGIQKAPLYAEWDNEGKFYYIRDINGITASGETKDWKFSGTTLTDANWKIVVDEKYSKFTVYYKNNSLAETDVYTIPIKQFTASVDVGHNSSGDSTVPEIIIPFATPVNFNVDTCNYNEGKITFTIPQGSTYNFTVPNGVKLIHSSLTENTEFTYTESSKKVDCLKSVTEDNKFGCKYVTVTITNNGGSTETSTSVFEGNTATINVTNFTGRHTEGITAGSLDSDGTVATFNNVTDDITCSINWVLDVIRLSISTNNDDNIEKTVDVNYDDSYNLGVGDTVTGYDFVGWEIVS